MPQRKKSGNDKLRTDGERETDAVAGAADVDPPQIAAENVSEALELAMIALRSAHSLIVRAAEGKPVHFNRLENYFSDMSELQRLFDAEGRLLDGFLEDCAESMEPLIRPAPTPAARRTASATAKQNVTKPKGH